MSEDDAGTAVLNDADAEAAAEQSRSDQAQPTETDVLAALQQENEELRQRSEELLEAQTERRSLRDRLEQAERHSAQLRQQCADLALADAIDQAAANLGISPESASIFRSRFTCELDSEGQPQIQPDPAELLAEELRSNPLLRESLTRGRQDRQAAAVVNGASEVTEADPTELMAALDRRPSRKAQFIRRHGTQAFLDLAEAARRKGYRG